MPRDGDGAAARGDRPRAPGPRRLAVVVKGWPRLSETFIAQELVALEARGLALEIWSLRRPTDAKRHPLHDRLAAPVRYLPEYLHEAPLRVAAGFGWMLARRSGWRLLGLWTKDFRRDVSRNRVRRLGQAAVLARELGPDRAALYAHFLHTPTSVARYAAHLLGRPFAASAHAKDIWTSPDWEIAEKLAEARFVATCTAYGAARLRGLAPEPERVLLVYHGLDLGRFPPPPERRAEPITPERPLALLSVGRLVEKKGYDRLVEALALAPADLPWRFVHLGGGPLKAVLAARAAELGLAGRIEWRGPADQGEVIAAMRAADLFVLPSRVAADGDRDGLPNVLMEAASQSLAILATPVAAIPEFVVDGVSGALVEDRPEALAAAIAGLAADPERRIAYGAAARARLLAEFDAGPSADGLAARLTALLDAAAAAPQAGAER